MQSVAHGTNCVPRCTECTDYQGRRAGAFLTLVSGHYAVHMAPVSAFWRVVVRARGATHPDVLCSPTGGTSIRSSSLIMRLGTAARDVSRCGANAVSLCCEHPRSAPSLFQTSTRNPESAPGSLFDAHHTIIAERAGSSTLSSCSSPSSSSPSSGVAPARHKRRLLLLAVGSVAFVGSRRPTEVVASLARVGEPGRDAAGE